MNARARCARSLFCYLACALAGCSSMPEKPPELTTRIETVTIKVPVPIPCVAAVEKPPIPPTNMRPGTDPEVLNAQMRADLDDWRAYAIRADVLLTSCINAASPPKGP